PARSTRFGRRTGGRDGEGALALQASTPREPPHTITETIGISMIIFDRKSEFLECFRFPRLRLDTGNRAGCGLRRRETPRLGSGRDTFGAGVPDGCGPGTPACGEASGQRVRSPPGRNQT